MQMEHDMGQMGAAKIRTREELQQWNQTHKFIKSIMSFMGIVCSILVETTCVPRSCHGIQVNFLSPLLQPQTRERAFEVFAGFNMPWPIGTVLMHSSNTTTFASPTKSKESAYEEAVPPRALRRGTKISVGAEG